MKRVILLGLAGAAVAWGMDFGQMSTEELINMRGQIGVSDRAAFRSEMQKRKQTSQAIPRQMLAQNRGQGMGRGQGRGKGGGSRGQNQPSFADYDLNGDGKIVQDEFYKAQAARMTQKSNTGRQLRNAGNAPSFESIDTNGDKVITPAEFRAHQQKRSNTRGRRGRGRTA